MSAWVIISNQTKPLQFIIMCLQVMPLDLTEESIRNYATNFFGYGSWAQSRVWIINLEEWGCRNANGEFSRRFNAWLQMQQPSLVNLQCFLHRAEIQVEWNNPTWRAYHGILRLANIVPNESMNQNQNYWGQCADNGIALIETMPFPARGLKHWPYVEWNFPFMLNRPACDAEFLERRITTILQRQAEYQPPFVIGCNRIRNKLQDYEVQFVNRGNFSMTHHLNTLFLFPLKFGRWISNETRRDMAEAMLEFNEN